MEFTGDFEKCQILLKVFFEGAQIDLCVRLNSVIAASCLTAQLVCHRDNSDLADAREGIYKLFDFSWVNIFTHAYNHILDAVNYVIVAVLITACNVSCVEPAVGKRRGCCFFIFPVAVHDIRSLHEKLSSFALGYVKACLRVYDTEFHIWDGRAY